MSAQGASDFLHGLDAAAHGLKTPEVQEQAGPIGRVVGPELLEVLLEQVSADGLQVVAEQIAEAELLLGSEILLALEHAPARLLQQRRMSIARQPARFSGTNLIQGLVHFGGDVEAVQDMQGQGTLVPNHVQIGLPHIRADKQNPGSHLLTDDGEEALKRFDGAFLADPQQANESRVDLVDQGQVLVAFGVLDFIHADGVDRLQRAMLQAPVDHILDSIMHPVPGGVERLSGFLPGELARPAGQEQHVGFGGMVFAVAPRKFLCHYAAIMALHASPTVEQEDQKAPERDELEAPFREPIVTGRRLVASGAHRLGALAWPHRDLDGLPVATEAGLLVYESPMRMALV